MIRSKKQWLLPLVSALVAILCIPNLAVSQDTPANNGPSANAQNAPAAEGPQIPWQTDLEAAKAEAAKSEKPMLLDFTAAWCGPCRMMNAQVFPETNVVKTVEDFVPVKLDEAKIDAAIIKQYKVDSFPTFVILSSDGKEVARATGAMPADGFLDFLKYAQAGLTLEKDAENLEALYTRGRYGVLFAPTVEEKKQQVEAALKAIGEKDNEKRARLLMAKALLSEPAEGAKVPEEAYKYLREAMQLDPENEFGVREEAAYVIMVMDFQKSDQKDTEKLLKDVNAYLEQFPAEKIREKNLAAQVLELQFRLRLAKGDFEGGIESLQAMKKVVDNEQMKTQIDGVIENIRAEVAKQAAPGNNNGGQGAAPGAAPAPGTTPVPQSE